MATDAAPYIVSARKYRPDSFASVVGQSTVVKTLVNAIQMKHIAQAYLFCGPRGIGKTSCARILAKTINCEAMGEGAEPCNQCVSCREFNEGRSLNIFELDAASHNSVEDIRYLIEMVHVPPQSGRYKIFIIDEVHMLSVAAFNAFLKTLEEPPAYAIFILATTEKHKILPTIISRCQVLDFKRMGVRDIVKHLQYIAQQEGVMAEADALHVIAQKADGAMRDALSIFDMMVSVSNKQITYQQVVQHLNLLDTEIHARVVDCLYHKNIPQLLLCLDEVVKSGFDLPLFLAGLAEHFRNLLVASFPQTIPLLEVTDNARRIYEKQKSFFDITDLQKALNILAEAELKIRQAKYPRFYAENILLLLLRELNEKKNDLSTKPPLEFSHANAGQKKVINTTKVIGEPVAAERNNQLPTDSPVSPENKNSSNDSFRTEDKENSEAREKERKMMPKSILSIGEIPVKKENAILNNNPTENEKHIEAIPLHKSMVEKAIEDLIDNYHNSLIFKTLLSNKTYRIEGHKLILRVINSVQEEAFHTHKKDFTALLKDKLKNPTLVLEMERAEVPNIGSVSGSVSPEEKLQQMIERNPIVKSLIDTFGLKLH